MLKNKEQNIDINKNNHASQKQLHFYILYNPFDFKKISSLSLALM